MSFVARTHIFQFADTSIRTIGSFDLKKKSKVRSVNLRAFNTPFNTRPHFRGADLCTLEYSFADLFTDCKNVYLAAKGEAFSRRQQQFI